MDVAGFPRIVAALAAACIFYLTTPRTADGQTAVHSASAAAPWRDLSPHRVQFVNVEKGLQLEVLDWGGRGRPVVLLAASGDTAHEFDDFAPKLTDRYHVYGITRRGFGRSGFVAGEYGSDLRGNDVLAVIVALGLKKPVLVGHSFAGSELSSVANRDPQRLAGVIYLDAAFPYAFDNGKGMSAHDFQHIVREPPAPPPNAADLSSLEAFQDYNERVHGIRLPKAELSQLWEVMPDGRVGQHRTFPGSALLMMGLDKYEDIPIPALVIFANPHYLGPWTLTNTDPAVRAAIDAYTSEFEEVTDKQANAIREAVRTARVVIIPNASHFVFLSNEADVLREMRAFIASLE